MTMDAALFESGLSNICGRENVRKAVPMSEHTTFRTGGPADYFVSPGDRESYIKLISFLRQSDSPFFILGRGSNILVGDKGYRGTVIDTSPGLSRVGIDGEIIEAEAGAGLSVVAGMAAEEALSGMEFASGIPGTIGGAVFMNAGAYGGEMSQIVASVELMDQNGKDTTLRSDEMGFAYRTSIAQKKALPVISVKIRLHRGDKDNITEKIKDLGRQRAEKQPLEYPSAGSTFKRPEGYFAGKLISDAGLSGHTLGGACVSPKHNGFIINMGNASSADILGLIKEVQETVRAKFGVELIPEVRIIGEF